MTSHVDSVTPTTTTCFGVNTSVIETSSLLSSPLYATSCRTGNDNFLPSITLHTSRPIPSIMEEHPAPTSLCQRTTVEICTDDSQFGCGAGNVLVCTAVRSRPVTSRSPRATIHSRAASMPSWRPLNTNVDGSEHRLVPPVPTSPAAAFGLGQLEENSTGAGDFEDVQEISISSPRTTGGGRGGVASSNASISISLSGHVPVAGSRRMSHVTPDFDPSPLVIASQQVRATSRPIHHDDRRPGRARDAADGAGKADQDAARRRYFSIAEWNRQKVLHLRRASLRRACLTGIPFSWTHLAGTSDRRQGKDGAMKKCRRRQASKHETTTKSACSERRQPQSTADEIQTRSYRTQPLAPISEITTVIPDSSRVASRRATTKSDRQQNNNHSTSRRAMACVNGCPPLTLPAQRTQPSCTVSHRTQRSARKEPLASGQTVAVQAQQKSEAYDSGLDSDAATCATTDHQSLSAANVDLQKVKDVLERPASRGRTHKDDDEDRDNEAKCESKDTTSNNCIEHAQNSNYERDGKRQSLDLPR